MAQGFIVAQPTRLLKPSADTAIFGALVPASDWSIATYETGSTTPKATYSDGQLLSLNTNPVEADADGYVRIFVGQGDTVKCVVLDGDAAEQYSFDFQQPMISDPAAGSVTAVPAGTCVWSTYSTVPTGFLYCDGSAVSRATYAALNTLAAADGYKDGAGNGTTTFNLPDMRGRAAYGLAASGTGSTAGTLAAFGQLDHVHTGPSHTHVTTVPRDGWGASLNTPATTGRMRTGDAAGTGTEASAEQATADQAVTSAAGGTGDTGSANPPGVAGYWFVKT